MRNSSRLSSSASRGTRIGLLRISSQVEKGNGIWKRSQLLRHSFQPVLQVTGIMGNPVSWASAIAPSCTT